MNHFAPNAVSPTCQHDQRTSRSTPKRALSSCSFSPIPTFGVVSRPAAHLGYDPAVTLDPAAHCGMPGGSLPLGGHFSLYHIPASQGYMRDYPHNYPHKCLEDLVPSVCCSLSLAPQEEGSAVCLLDPAAHCGMPDRPLHAALDLCAHPGTASRRTRPEAASSLPIFLRALRVLPASHPQRLIPRRHKPAHRHAP
jgi:hypothetical protein